MCGFSHLLLCPYCYNLLFCWDSWRKPNLIEIGKWRKISTYGRYSLMLHWTPTRYRNKMIPAVFPDPTTLKSTRVPCTLDRTTLMFLRLCAHRLENIPFCWPSHYWRRTSTPRWHGVCNTLGHVCQRAAQLLPLERDTRKLSRSL